MGLIAMVFNNGYIRWKILLGLGTAFWVMLCLYDTYLVDPVTKSYYSELAADDFGWLSQVSEEEIVAEGAAFGREDNIQFPDETYGLVFYLVLWNILTFIFSFTACALGKVMCAYWWKFTSLAGQVITPESIEQATKKCNLSKIPVLCGSKSATTNTLDDLSDKSELPSHEGVSLKAENVPHLGIGSNFLRGSSTSIDLTMRHGKNDLPSRHEQQMEKQCAKLRDEMILIQASSLKEHAALSRKLELVTKEKRDLCRQLMLAQKENRAAKMQLEELLSEKSMLLKRLECASKEFKSNTKSKKQALAKLEESQAAIASLKQELEKISKEKEVLKAKIQVLDVEHKLMKDRLAKYESSLDKFNASENSSGPNDQASCHVNQTVCNLSKDFKSDMAEISQSQRDVQRVQVRLINLEKSLDKLKFGRWTKNSQESNIDLNIKTDQEETVNVIPNGTDNNFQNANLISTLSENPLEQEESGDLELSNNSDNLTDEQRRKILAPSESSGDECCSTSSKRFDTIVENYRRIEDPFERAGNIFNFLKRNSSPRGDNNFDSDFPINETSTSVNEDEDTDEWEPPKHRFVSDSAAFKRFMKSMEYLDKNQRKFVVS